MTITWHGSDGQTIPLDGSAGVTLASDATEGISHLPIDLRIEPRVASDGGVLTSQSRAPRRVILDLLLSQDVRVLHAHLLRSMASGGELSYAGPDGVRTLRGVTLESVDRSMSAEDLGHRLDDVFAVSLIALDPWWYGAAELIEIDLDDEGTAWDAPIDWDADVPWDGGWAVEIEVPGDAPASPVWAATGPLTSLTVVSGQEAWRATTPMNYLQAIQLDTRPGNRGPRWGADLIAFFPTPGPVDWTLLDEASRLFTLPAGTSDLIVGPAGQDAGARLFVGFEPRYLTP